MTTIAGGLATRPIGWAGLVRHQVVDCRTFLGADRELVKTAVWISVP